MFVCLIVYWAYVVCIGMAVCVRSVVLMIACACRCLVGGWVGWLCVCFFVRVCFPKCVRLFVCVLDVSPCFVNCLFDCVLVVCMFVYACVCVCSFVRLVGWLFVCWLVDAFVCFCLLVVLFVCANCALSCFVDWLWL